MTIKKSWENNSPKMYMGYSHLKLTLTVTGASRPIFLYLVNMVLTATDEEKQQKEKNKLIKQVETTG